jgi:hypothetical protein
LGDFVIEFAVSSLDISFKVLKQIISFYYIVY